VIELNLLMSYPYDELLGTFRSRFQ